MDTAGGSASILQNTANELWGIREGLLRDFSGIDESLAAACLENIADSYHRFSQGSREFPVYNPTDLKPPLTR